MDSQKEIRDLESKNAELEGSIAHRAGGQGPVLPPPPNSAGTTGAGYLRRHGGASGGSTPQNQKSLRKGVPYWHHADV